MAAKRCVRDTESMVSELWKGQTTGDEVRTAAAAASSISAAIPLVRLTRSVELQTGSM